MALFKNRRLFSIGIVVVSAILVEILSIIQFRQLEGIMSREMGSRSRMMLRSMVDHIQNALDRTEYTMKENLWDVRRSMAHPDSVFSSMIRLIDDNPNVLGGCLAVSPYYYPSKGRLFEPYASKQSDGTIILQQLGGPDHDYTQNPEYLWVLEHRAPSWTDPYLFGPESLSLATYSYPLMDNKGDIVAVCGLDIDVSWLGDTLNLHQPFPSSFGLLLTPEGELVTGPQESRVPRATVQKVVDVINGVLPESAIPDLAIRKSALKKEPFWQIVEVYDTDEVLDRLRRFRRQNLLFLLIGMAFLAFMINRYARNEKNLRKASEEQARVSSELAVARRIQQEMLPTKFPQFVYGTLEPALAVGGDLYDFFIRDGKLFFCIGDVSGKGVPSAMLMSVIHSLFRVVSEKEESPSRILTVLNTQACRDNDTNMFVTFFVGCLDLYTGKFRYSNAGHDKPFLLSGNVSVLPSKANLPLGVFPDTVYEEEFIELTPGSSIFLYTDGLTEAKNSQRKPFGKSRLEDALRQSLSSSLSPEQTVLTLRESAHEFIGGAPQSDDLTMLLIHYPKMTLFKESLVLKNKVEELSKLSDFLKGICAKLQLEGKLGLSIRLAVEEMVVNVVSYAYPSPKEGTVSIYADSDFKELRFTIVDKGIPFDPTAVVPQSITLSAEERSIGGLGILLSREIMDSVSYCRKTEFNVLTLTKSIV